MINQVQDLRRPGHPELPGGNAHRPLKRRRHEVRVLRGQQPVRSATCETAHGRSGQRPSSTGSKNSEPTAIMGRRAQGISTASEHGRVPGVRFEGGPQKRSTCREFPGPRLWWNFSAKSAGYFLRTPSTGPAKRSPYGPATAGRRHHRRPKPVYGESAGTAQGTAERRAVANRQGGERSRRTCTGRRRARFDGQDSRQVNGLEQRLGHRCAW